jgi:hypothetical protein
MRAGSTAILLLFAACHNDAAGVTQSDGTRLTQAPPYKVDRVHLGLPNLAGLSGLTRDTDGRLWTVAERSHAIASMRPDGREARRIPLDGVPSGVDLESIAWLSGNRFALGSEGKVDGRTSDSIFIAEVTSDRARIRESETITVNYDIWGLPAAPRNQGIEGLCAVGPFLVIALETPLPGSPRRAFLGRYHLEQKTWERYELLLTSETGKISSLHCRPRGDAIELLAIERHFEVFRLLDFSIPPSPPAGPLQAHIIADLASFRRHDDNPEGAVWIEPNSYAVVLDNQTNKKVTGPNELLLISPTTP